MMFSFVDTKMLACEELAVFITQVRMLTNGGYDRYDQNEDTIIRLLDKILLLSKKEKEWYVYFDTLYNMFYMLNRGGNHKKILKYAEIYYKDSMEYMDKELPNYRETDMAETNTYCCSNIFDAYIGYHQIDDRKMENFMGMYKETVHKYGGEVHYYKDEMSLAALYRDKERFRQAKNNFEKYEVENCYVCMHLPYFPYYFLNNDMKSAEEFLDIILKKQIPKKHQWCYERCQNTKELVLYHSILEDCLSIGNAKFFQYIYEKYWKKIAKRQNPEDGRSSIGTSIFCCAIAGDFSERESDLKNAEQELKFIHKNSTVNACHRCLRWWGYFKLLEKSGAGKIELPLPEKEKTILTAEEAAAYFEEKADEYGELFGKARKRFDYSLIKNTYRECAGL